MKKYFYVFGVIGLLLFNLTACAPKTNTEYAATEVIASESTSDETAADYLAAAGEIVAVSTVEDLPVITIEIDPGKKMDLTLQKDTKIIAWPDKEMIETFRENPPLFTEIMAFVDPEGTDVMLASGQKTVAHDIQTLYIERMKAEEDQLTMDDGTVLEVWRGYRSSIYQLEDGTEICRGDLPVGPDKVESNGVNLDGLEGSVWENIEAYYEEQGQQYQIHEIAAHAYEAYTEKGADGAFTSSRITQYVLPVSIDEEKITIMTLIRKNEAGCMQEISWETVFDRKTGKRME